MSYSFAYYRHNPITGTNRRVRACEIPHDEKMEMIRTFENNCKTPGSYQGWYDDNVYMVATKVEYVEYTGIAQFA